MHRGPKAGKVTKQSSKKKSALRADAMFKNGTATSTSSGGLAHLPSQLPMQATMTTPSESEDILSWVSVRFRGQSPFFFSKGC